MKTVIVPKSEPQAQGPVHYLKMVSTVLGLLAGIVALLTQIVEHLQKPKAGPGERTQVDTAVLGLKVLAAAPAIVKATRTLKADAAKTGVKS